MNKRQKNSKSVSNLKYKKKNKNINETSSILKLNEDCLMYIFSFLSISERIRLQRVCKHWQKVSTLPWTDVNALDISYFPAPGQDKKICFTPPILKQILKLCGRSLRHFEYSVDSNGIWTPSALLTIINKMCPNICSLKITCGVYNRDAVECLADNFTELTSFVMGNCLSKYENVLSIFFSKNKRLKSIEICGHDNRLTGTCLKYLPADIIEIISISGCKNLALDHFEKILPTFTKLHSLIIKDNIKLLRNFDRLLNLIPSKSTFQNITLRDYQFVYANAPNYLCLQYFKNLRILNLQGDRILTNKMLKIVAKHCTKLTHVTLSSSVQVNSAAMRSITGITDLEYLELKSLNELKQQPFHHMEKLQIFKCTECNKINNIDLSDIVQNSKNLKYLLVSDCEGIDIERLITDVKTATDKRTNSVIMELHIRTEDRQPKIIQYSSRLRIVEEPTLWIY